MSHDTVLYETKPMQQLYKNVIYAAHICQDLISKLERTTKQAKPVQPINVASNNSQLHFH